jgi:dienelactone hydrolase
MTRLALAAAMMLLATSMSQGVRAQTADIAARTELHAIPSQTLSDGAFLTGKDGKPVTVTGQLRVAQGSGRLPVVVLMHGSGGMSPGIDTWSRLFNAMGISTFAVDGFTGRGLTGVSTDQSQLGRLNFIMDLYGALALLAKHPRVDPQRIALMGFSRGGQAALYASEQRFNKLWNKSGAGSRPTFRSIPTVPRPTSTTPTWSPSRSASFHGARGRLQSGGVLPQVRRTLKAAGRDVVLTEYADAHHGYDTPLGSGPVVAKGSQTVRNCSLVEKADGVLVNAATNEPFSYRDACVQLDPQVGRNAAAATATQAAVTEFVRTLFALK